MEMQGVADMGGQVFQVFAVFFRQDDIGDMFGTMGVSVSLIPPIGSTWPRRVISPVIATSWRTGCRVRAVMTAVARVMTRGGAVFRRVAVRHVDVDIRLGEMLSGDVEWPA